MMDNFKLPITPSHLAVGIGVVIMQVDPEMSGEKRALFTFGILSVYIIGESVYNSVKAKHLRIPTEAISELRQRLSRMERSK